MKELMTLKWEDIGLIFTLPDKLLDTDLNEILIDYLNIPTSHVILL